jgi:hypothetical protein
MAKVSFKKYEYENIRTEYKELSSAAEAKVEARTIVTAAGAVASDAGIDDVDNSTNFVLAEDIKIGDLGFVYYIIENTDNLV